MPYKILFLCTGNSARSILSEFITREYFSDKFELELQTQSISSQLPPQA